ncbi:peptide/nickel transport system ATP-binding protein [Salirhabdus euzebyi]|uniref:Peptide/nickel transport system ATP-binding protein n=1 Tax=Salirhabdus euzebyi TaxID=394506 RepID=A0A841Q5W7_9BACI|nr:dipeptide ABC transporter ATP-binding protein [Salirhabdus euzebyi]MBB6453747.1 peptide/nickel transport system ATP-binding protein [Salirhabdus euzebyi]
MTTKEETVHQDQHPLEKSNILIEAKNLKKYFPVKGGMFNRQKSFVKAVDDISLKIYEGETFSLVGESGSGKSTLGRALLRLQEPTDGSIFFEGQDITSLKKEEMRKIRHNMQVIYQDPFGSLNPRMKVTELIGEPFRINKIASGKELEKRVIELMELVGLDPSRRNRYPHEFSGGQRQRIGIARAIALNPKFILADEAVSALDVSVQAQVINLMKDLQRDLGLTYLFIAHGLNVVRHISDRVGVMYLGHLVEVGEVEELYKRPAHPYTSALISTNPTPNPRAKREKVILKGEIPSPSNPPSGCRFHTRCPLATDRCKTEAPKLVPISEERSVACHYPLV